MNAVRHPAPATAPEARRDVNQSGGAPSAPMTPTLTEPLCGRPFFHVAHPIDAGQCEGYVDPAQLTAGQIHERVDRLRREATAYGYQAGYADAAEGRDYSNAWREDES